MGRVLALAISAALCWLALAGPAPAATIAPTVLTDDVTANGNCTLREAVQATNTNSDVDLCDHDGLAGEDTINLSEDTPAADEFDLNLVGTGDDDNLTGDFDVQAGTGGLRFVGAGAGASIDGNEVDRILHIESGAVEVQGVTFSQGLSPAGTPGGAIFTQTSSDASLELTNSVVNSNTAGGAGGGLQVSGSGGATITNSTIDQNAAAGGGGISHSSAGPLTITNSTIADNNVNAAFPAVSGGGIAFNPPSDAALTITGSLVDNNTVTSTTDTRGGGVNVEGVGSMTVNISSSVISNNDAVATGLGISGGGGLRFGAPAEDVTVTDSVISGNTSTVSAAGASNVGAGVLNLGTTEIQRSTISGNSLSSGVQGGGGVRDEGSLALVNSTVANNSAATGSGGGLDGGVTAADATSVFNSTFSGNTAVSPDALRRGAGTLTIRGSIVDNADQTDACSGGPTSTGFNLDVGTTCGFMSTGDEENADPQLGLLANNGGPDAGPTGNTQTVQTQLPTLTSDALDQIPAADCTDENGPGNPLTVDQRTFPRPFDSDNAGGVDCEAGSVEVFQCNGAPATHVGTAAADVITGGVISDVIVGAGGNDTLNGADNDDQLCGNEGDDTLAGGAGTDPDQFNGGPGLDDEVTFAGVTDPLSVNLTLGTSSGAGNDTFNGVENLRGGSGGDGLVGNVADNELRGGAGDDFMAAGVGDDLMDGEAHDATGDGVSYSVGGVQATGPITASLQAGTATGQGNDTLLGLENLRGGNFVDDLTGDAGANVVEGGGAFDTITGLGGMDDLQGEALGASIFARDGVQDDVDCGGGAADPVQADQEGVDLIENCESIDFFVPPPPPPPPPAVTPIIPTTTPPAPATKKKCKKKKKGRKGAVAAKKCKKKKKRN